MEPGLIIIGISGVLLLVGIILWQKGNHLLLNGKKAQAIIYKNIQTSDREGGVYYPVVRFLTDKKEWITQKLSIGLTPALPEGTKLEVIYDPDDPTTVEINSPGYLEILPRVLVAVGLIGLMTGVLEYAEIIAIFS